MRNRDDALSFFVCVCVPFSSFFFTARGGVGLTITRSPRRGTAPRMPVLRSLNRRPCSPPSLRHPSSSLSFTLSLRGRAEAPLHQFHLGALGADDVVAVGDEAAPDQRGFAARADEAIVVPVPVLEGDEASAADTCKSKRWLAVRWR